jgi:cysteinyl-tRNA synthetase
MSVSTRAMPKPDKLSTPHPTLRVYNTLSKRKEPFATVQPGKAGIYLCGPTVYDKSHIGHMVGPVIFDCMKRYLTYCGYKVNWVVNITDVDDKLIKKANERGISMLQVAEENIADYNSNLAALGVDQIDHFPRATDCMPEIIDFVKCLVDRSIAYESDGDVYFDVGKDPEYGKLSNRSIESLQGEGGAGGERKRHVADFALWKAAKPGEPSSDSPSTLCFRIMKTRSPKANAATTSRWCSIGPTTACSARAPQAAKWAGAANARVKRPAPKRPAAR